MKKQKSQKGITLIALIITIVVLLILAVIAIGAVQESGIITHAQKTATDYNSAKADEEGKIEGYEALIESKLPGGNDVSKVTYTDEGVPVPAGFKVVTGTKDTGLVIENETEGSQFVWVPVENINTMVMCKSKTASDQCSIKLNKEKNELLCENHSNSTDICGKLYGDPYMVDFNIGRTDQTYTSSGSSEPYDLSGETDTTYQAEFNEMAISVAKNGGFYVGRYEVSFNESREAQSKGSTDAVPVYSAINSTTSTTNNNATDWYGLYELCKTYNTSSVKSSMIWGSQYDAMMIWMGNHATSFNSNNRNTDSQRRTGYVSTDVIRNVYDLGGNSYEFTLEAYGTSSRVFRSGSRLLGNATLIKRMIATLDFNGGCGSRLALYIL